MGIPPVQGRLGGRSPTPTGGGFVRDETHPPHLQPTTPSRSVRPESDLGIEPREMPQYPSPLSLSSNCCLDGHPTLTVLRYNNRHGLTPPNVWRAPLERRHSILDSSYPDSFLSDDKALGCPLELRSEIPRRHSKSDGSDDADFNNLDHSSNPQTTSSGPFVCVLAE